METEISHPHLEELLEPLAFKRENYIAHLYIPYSSKIRRRVHLYTHDAYDLWVRLETDPNVLQFNERVKPLPLSFSDGRASVASPDFISKAQDGITIHSFCTNAEVTEQKLRVLEAWNNYSQLEGFHHKIWSQELLYANKIELANYKRLLRFTCEADPGIDYKFEQAVLTEISTVRKTVFFKILEQFPLTDPEVTKSTIARLILGRQIYSDIHLSPISMLTEVSAFHDFPQK